MRALFALATVGLAAGLLAGCSSEPEEVVSYPFADYDAQAWFNEFYEESSCPYPDKPETMCKTTTDVRVKPVELPAGTVLDQSDLILPSDTNPPPRELVTLAVPQTVWCFVVRDYERSLDYFDVGEERVTYSYPCWTLGDNPNNLSSLAGYLQPDGTIANHPSEECRREFPGDLLDEEYQACMSSIVRITDEPDW